MEEEDHFTQTLLPLLSHTAAQGSKPAAFGISSFSLGFSCSLLYSHILLSNNASIYRHEWQDKRPSIMAQMVAAYGLHHFVNGWCNYHCSLLTMATLLLRVGCTSCCPLMAISQQSPPLTFI